MKRELPWVTDEGTNYPPPPFFSLYALCKFLRRKRLRINSRDFSVQTWRSSMVEKNPSTTAIKWPLVASYCSHI